MLTAYTIELTLGTSTIKYWPTCGATSFNVSIEITHGHFIIPIRVQTATLLLVYQHYLIDDKVRNDIIFS